MAKAKQAYFWRGKGELRAGKRMIKTNMEVPAGAIDAETIKAMLKTGDISIVSFDIVESSTEVSGLEAKLEELCSQIIDKDKMIKELELKLDEATKKVAVDDSKDAKK